MHLQVDTKEHLPQAEKQAREEREKAEKAFIAWASQYCPDVKRMNVSSDVQRAHLLFAPAYKKTSAKGQERSLVDFPPTKVQPKAGGIDDDEIHDSGALKDAMEVFEDLHEVEPDEGTVALKGREGNYWPRERYEFCSSDTIFHTLHILSFLLTSQKFQSGKH